MFKPKYTKTPRKKKGGEGGVLNKEWGIKHHLGDTEGSEVVSTSALGFCHCSARTARLMGSVGEKISSCFAAW